MMTPLERLFYTTVRLVGCDRDGIEMGATAFFFDHELSDEVYLIANTHAVSDMVEGKITFHTKRGNGPDPRGTVAIDILEFDRLWAHHPGDMDLAILPISSIAGYIEATKKRIYFQALNQSMIPTEEVMDERIDAVEDVYFMGYPNGIFDEVNYLPVMRKGTTATPIHMNYNGKPWFLLDANIFPGSSGSPVLLIDRSDRYDKDGVLDPVQRIYFLGVVRSGFTYAARMERARQMMDLGVVIRSDAILDMIDTTPIAPEVMVGFRSKVKRMIRF